MAEPIDASALAARFPALGETGPDDVAAIDNDDCYVLIRSLAFDAGILGRKVGRASFGERASRAALARAIAIAKERSYERLVITVSVRNEVAIATLEAERFSLIDVGIVFRHTLAAIPPEGQLADGLVIRGATLEDIPALRDMQHGLFRESRFYSDPDYTRETADEVFRRWIENCVRGRADVVFLAEDRGAPVGFFTCKVNPAGIGVIDLVGVIPSAAGRGVGRALAHRALAWFDGRASEVHVKTQVINVHAAALYTGCGFRLFESDLTYRRSLGDGASTT